MDTSHREFLKSTIRAEFEASLDQRVDRFISIGHQPIIADHHFADASSECIKLFRDGYFIACITLTQSVAEGIVKFVRDRNSIAPLERETRQELALRLHTLNIVSADFVQAYSQIYSSFRDHFHHMNPQVAEIELEPLARRNIADLATLEQEIFDFTAKEGKLIPRHLRYWDVKTNGHVPAYLRLV